MRAAFAALAASAFVARAEVDPGLDPTVLHSRVKVTNEFVDREFDASRKKTKLLLSHAFGNVERRDWTLQLDLPFVAYHAGTLGGTPDADGIGDIEMRIGHVFDGEGIFRWGLGVETQLNTAAQPQLGDGVWRLAPVVVVAVQPCREFKFQTSAQFDQSITREASVGEQQEVKVKPSMTFNLPEKFYVYVESELKWDIADEDAFSAKLKCEIGRGFGARGEWVVSARYEMPLTESADQHTLTAGVAYVFP